MAKTTLTNVIEPDIWEAYIIERTAELASFGQSGVMETSPAFDAKAAGGGRTVNMPNWKDIDQARQIISDSSSFTVNNIDKQQDIARIHNDGNAWSVTLLAELFSGDDPMGAIGDLLAEYWARRDEEMIVSSLLGLFASFDAGAGNNILSIAGETTGTTAANELTGTTFIDALQVLGDRAARLTALATNSAVEADIKKKDLISFIPDSEGKPAIEAFQGRIMIVDDSIPSRAGTTSGTVWRTFLFGPGFFGKGSANLSGEPLQGGFGTHGVEFARDALAHDDILINRRRYILHPRGVQYTSTTETDPGGPTNAELELAANWTKIWQEKNIRVVIVEHNNAGN